MQQIITSSEFAELLAEERINPRGVLRDNYHAGIIASTVANIYRSSSSRIARPDDYILDFEPAEEKNIMPEEEMKAKLKQIATEYGHYWSARGKANT